MLVQVSPPSSDRTIPSRSSTPPVLEVLTLKTATVCQSVGVQVTDTRAKSTNGRFSSLRQVSPPLVERYTPLLTTPAYRTALSPFIASARSETDALCGKLSASQFQLSPRSVERRTPPP